MKREMPKWDSQNWYILHYLLAKPITPIEALEHCGTMRLSERIRELERMGYTIRHEWKRLPSGKRVMSYILEQD